MKRVLKTSLIVTMVLLLLSACQNDSNLMVEEEGLSGKLRIAIINPTHIGNGRVHQLDEASKGPLYDKLRAFQTQNPNLDIELIDISFVTGEPSTIPTDPLPDIIEVVPYQTRWVAGPDELENLDPVVQLSGWNGAYAQLIDRTRVNGKAIMIPVKSEPMVVYYDEHIFGQLNIPAPHESWTWDDFVSASEQLNSNGFITDIPDKFDAVEPIIQGLGGAYTSEDGLHFIEHLDSDSTVAAFERYVSDMRVQRSNAANKGGQKALGIGRPSDLYSLLNDNINLRIARMPLFADGKRHNTMLTTGLAVSAESKNKTAAVELLRALVGDNEGEALRFANYNALVGESFNYMDKPLVQQEELLRVMEMETANSVPTTFQLNPQFFNHYGILNERSKEFADVFPMLLEQNSIKLALEMLASHVETLFQTQRGNW